jgi:uncharacterized membrane protein
MNEPSKARAPASVAQNTEKVVQVENEALRPRCGSEAITDAIGGFVGTISFVVLQCLAFAGWLLVNAGTTPQVAPFDPFPYPLLSSITSLEAVLLTAFVLIKQNRMGIIADRRDHLDLQVNLLTERQATQIIQMLDRLSTHLGVDQHHDADSRELGRHVAVEHLVEEAQPPAGRVKPLSLQHYQAHRADKCLHRLLVLVRVALPRTLEEI